MSKWVRQAVFKQDLISCSMCVHSWDSLDASWAPGGPENVLLPASTKVKCSVTLWANECPIRCNRFAPVDSLSMLISSERICSVMCFLSRRPHGAWDVHCCCVNMSHFCLIMFKMIFRWRPFPCSFFFLLLRCPMLSVMWSQTPNCSKADKLFLLFWSCHVACHLHCWLCKKKSTSTWLTCKWVRWKRTNMSAALLVCVKGENHCSV